MASADLIVLMIGDSGLRGALAARLTLLGENVVTVSHGLDDPDLERLARHNAVLIADQAMLGDQLVTILADSGWHRVIELGDGVASHDDERVVRLDRNDGVAQAIATLARWRGATLAE